MNNYENLKPVIDKLYIKLLTEDFVIDKTGVKCVEVLYENVILDPDENILDFGCKKTNEKYCLKELDWYNSKSLSIIDYVDDIIVWNQICTKDNKKEVNSNYGWCIYSDENYNQYNNTLLELINNKYSRRATMMYNRPSMHIDYNRNGMSDFCCTYYHQFFIRNNKLESIYSMRSNDFIYGFFNDFYWGSHIHNKLHTDLLQTYPNLESGNLLWSANSLHVYEKHFNLLTELYNSYRK